jgi:hypothetical protein
MSAAEKRHRSGSFWLLIIAVFIVCVAVGVYIATQPTATSPATGTLSLNSTSQWQTYRNEELGFAIKYPESIEKYDFPSPQPSYIAISIPSMRNKLVPSDEKHITIQWRENSARTPKQEVDLLIAQSPSFSDAKKADNERSAYTVDGAVGELFTAKYIATAPNHEARLVIIQGENKTNFSFYTLYLKSNKEKTLKLFDQVLSTFKFIEQK